MYVLKFCTFFYTTFNDDNSYKQTPIIIRQNLQIREFPFIRGFTENEYIYIYTFFKAELNEQMIIF